jgi:hypothetical protein
VPTYANSRICSNFSECAAKRGDRLSVRVKKSPKI